MDSNKHHRYVVNISFHQKTIKRTENIAQPVKSLKEAREYKSLIDDTVREALIFDKASQKVVEWLKTDRFKQ
jgi:hypothetical protein